MRKKLMQRLSAATAVALTVMPLTGYSPIGSGATGTTAEAKRAQAPQIEKNDTR